MADYDVIVVGVGIMGSAAIYHAARRGLKTLGLEQFGQLGHSLGSSHGQTRVIRQAYFEHPDYVPLVQDAWNQWQELERLTRQSLLVQTGGLMMGLLTSEVVAGAKTAAIDHHLPYEIWESDQVSKRFPAFHLAPDEVAVWEPMAGYIKAESSLLAMADYSAALGAVIQTGETVQTVTARSPHLVEVTTNKNRFTARSAIVTVGPWGSQWFSQWSLSVERQAPFWFDSPGLESMTSYPIYIHENRRGQHTYGFPFIAGQGLKIARHHGGVLTTPDLVERTVTSDDERDLKDTLEFLPDALESPIRHAEVCLYTNTPDNHFIIGRHSNYPGNVIVGAGFSGHGFKFAPTIGRHLVDLAVDPTCSELPLFSPHRNAIKTS